MTYFRQEMLHLAEKSLSKKEMKRDILIASRYFGWDGQGGSSMQVAGDEHGLTRERVRQISGKVVSKMTDGARTELPTLRILLEMIADLSPASADRIEAVLKNHGLNGDRVEGVLNAAKQFNLPGQHLKVIDEFGVRFVVHEDAEKVPSMIMSMAQKMISHQGLININSIIPTISGVNKLTAASLVRDVINTREDASWLDSQNEWVWLKDAPRNRLITCLSKMLSTFTTTCLTSVREGANRYYRKGKKIAQQIDAPDSILISFIDSWGHASYSKAGIIRKNDSFEASIDPLDMEESIALYILNNPGKIAREKELENAIVPDIDGETHPLKYNFSIALNYSPLIRKGDKRGQYVANGTL